MGFISAANGIHASLAEITGLIFSRQRRKERAGAENPRAQKPPPLGLCCWPCYDRLMKAFVGDVDHFGLRRLLPEDVVVRESLRPPGHRAEASTVFRVLLDDRDSVKRLLRINEFGV